jgi:hypothetical protein
LKSCMIFLNLETCRVYIHFELQFCIMQYQCHLVMDSEWLRAEVRALAPSQLRDFDMARGAACIITSAAIDASHAAVASPWLSVASHYRLQRISSGIPVCSHSQRHYQSQM